MRNMEGVGSMEQRTPENVGMRTEGMGGIDWEMGVQ